MEGNISNDELKKVSGEMDLEGIVKKLEEMNKKFEDIEKKIDELTYRVDDLEDKVKYLEYGIKYLKKSKNDRDDDYGKKDFIIPTPAIGGIMGCEWDPSGESLD